MDGSEGTAVVLKVDRAAAKSGQLLMNGKANSLSKPVISISDQTLKSMVLRAKRTIVVIRARCVC